MSEPPTPIDAAAPAGNIADALRTQARARPQAVAMQLALGGGRFASLSYAELEAASDEVAAGLGALGLHVGARVALMVRPSPAFFALMFGLFKGGLVPVLIDPGIAKRALKECLDEADPQAFIGIPLALVARRVLRWAPRAKLAVAVGPRWFFGLTTDRKLRAAGRAAITAGWQPPRTTPDDLAAILFTSGSTGLPKGVEYQHAQLLAQVELLASAFGIGAGEVDLATFPPFALFDPGMGMTSVIPEMDPTRPASADPRKLIAAIERFGVTTMFGSPALLDTLTRHAQIHDVRLQGLKRVLSAGAPVRPEIIERAYRMLPEGAQLWTPYGATECLPVAIVEGREILADARAQTDRGAGILVGRAVAPNEVRIIATCDAAIERWADTEALPNGEIGEIVVRGPTVTRAYFRRDAATRLAKIIDGETLWHRMGDLGYFDAHGRLWYLGRKSQRVVLGQTTLYPEQVEGIFNTHPQVKRSALVGVTVDSARQAWVLVEFKPEAHGTRWPQHRSELETLRANHPAMAQVSGFLPHRRFPVDIRHNAKIGREALARWATQQIPRHARSL